MTYADPKLKKGNFIRIRVDDYLNDEIEALCAFTGAQKAVLCRQLVELGLKEVHNQKSIGSSNIQEGIFKALSGVA